MPGTEKDKMLAGEPYRGFDPELVAERERAHSLLARFNAADADGALRTLLLTELLGAAGDGLVIQPTFTCDYGSNINIGRNGFINYHCVFLDCAPIIIGDDLQMAPMVQLYTALHPLNPDERRSGLESARAIRIGNNVWIGGGAIVLPGVTIGDDAVVGAGSVVTRDVAPATLVAGNPARVLRSIARAKPTGSGCVT
jgi:maltose O-acetyltransferase